MFNAAKIQIRYSPVIPSRRVCRKDSKLYKSVDRRNRKIARMTCADVVSVFDAVNMYISAMLQIPLAVSPSLQNFQKVGRHKAK